MIRDITHYARVPSDGGPAQITDDASFEAWWKQMAEAVEARTGRKVELKPHSAKPVAYVNWGRWVADCPECNGGIDCSPDLPRGACLDCGAVYRIDFPPKKERDQADALLSERPERNRNWDRHKGEDIKRLKTENELLNGVV